MMKKLLTTVPMIIGMILIFQGGYMDVKAKVSQILISTSWANRIAGERPIKPWWWADTRAIAKMEVPRLQQALYIMEDDSGESLAFGPGHMPASAKPSANGHVIIARHRDSHFEFLKDIQIGDVVSTENSNSIKKEYRVKQIEIIDTRDQEIDVHEFDYLTLITCYPFENFIPGGPLRLIVHAEPIEKNHSELLVQAI